MKVRQQVYDTYWQTAAERQEIFFKRLEGSPPPYTKDPIYQKFKFSNVYRASDRVSQFLIKNVIYDGKFGAEDTLFRIFLFRLINKVETWKLLEDKLGEITLKEFRFKRYAKALDEIKSSVGTIYGSAFILCANKAFGYDKKHQNHLALLASVFNGGAVTSFLQAKTPEQLFWLLRELPLIGDFMAYQIAIDFNYSEVFDFDENDFTIAGPGARRGIKKCFLDLEGKSHDYVIQYMVENQNKEFDRLGIRFRNLWGRPMHAIDCQAWFCETDKYSRVKFLELKSNRVRIKTVFKPSSNQIKYFYPPKWGINDKIYLNHGC